MGIRSIKRQMAKARLDAMDVGKTNKKLSQYGSDGRKAWKAALHGKTGQAAAFNQLDKARKKEAAERSKKVIARRTLRKV